VKIDFYRDKLKMVKYKRLDIKAGNIRSLDSVLNKWNKILHKYLEKTHYWDCHWWHIERAILSSFAAAVWKNGGIALEEYGLEKKRKKQSDKKRKQDRTYTGRCDLYFETGKQRFACEAKKITCGIGGKSNPSKTISLVKRELGKACDDAKRIPKDEGRRLGMCFAVPRLIRTDIENKNKEIIKFQEAIEKEIRYSSIAMVFPKNTKKKDKDWKYHYPGIILLIKEV
jgi:hypothetical protein